MSRYKDELPAAPKKVPPGIQVVEAIGTHTTTGALNIVSPGPVFIVRDGSDRAFRAAQPKVLIPMSFPGQR